MRVWKSYLLCLSVLFDQIFNDPLVNPKFLTERFECSFRVLSAHWRGNVGSVDHELHDSRLTSAKPSSAGVEGWGAVVREELAVMDIVFVTDLFDLGLTLTF